MGMLFQMYSDDELLRMKTPTRRGVDNGQGDNSLREDEEMHSNLNFIQKHFGEREASQYADHMEIAHLAIHHGNNRNKMPWSLDIGSCANMKKAVEMLVCKTDFKRDINTKNNAAYYIEIKQLDSNFEPFDEYMLMTLSETTSNPWFWDLSQGHPARVKNEDLGDGKFRITATRA